MPTKPKTRAKAKAKPKKKGYDGSKLFDADGNLKLMEFPHHPYLKHPTVEVRYGHEPILDTGSESYGKVDAGKLWLPLDFAIRALAETNAECMENDRDAESILYPLLCVAELAKVLHALGSGRVTPMPPGCLPLIGELPADPPAKQ